MTKNPNLEFFFLGGGGGGGEVVAGEHLEENTCAKIF